MLSDTTILIQGVPNNETFKLWIKNYKKYKVVVSIWDDVDLSNYRIPSHWNVIQNQYPLVRFKPTSNLDYQLITTINGLNLVDTEWVIKVRADEYYSNLELVVDKMKLNQNKIVSSSMYFRKWGMYKFHCGDKLIGGKLENVKLMFDKTLDNIKKNIWDTKIPESQLGFGYVYAKEPNINTKLLNKSNTHIEVFDSQKAYDLVSKAIEVSTKKLVEVVHRNMNPNNFSWDFMENNIEEASTIINHALNVIRIRHSTKVDEVDDVPYMKRWFDIVDINDLKPYIVTTNGGDGRKWYRDDFNNEFENCLTKIN
jgi:hypothetical protein